MEELSNYGLNQSNASLGGDLLDSSSGHHDPGGVLNTNSSSSSRGGKWRFMPSVESTNHARDTLLQWRSCVIFFWLISSVIVPTVTFFYMSHLEQEEFETTVSRMLSTCTIGPILIITGCEFATDSY